MRLIYTSQDKKKSTLFSEYLESKGIENNLEITKNADWGSHDYGICSCTIWIIDEDQVEEALKFLENFEKNPEDPRYKLHRAPLSTIEPNKANQRFDALPPESRGNNELPEGRLGLITLYILITCTLLLIYSSMTTPTPVKPPIAVPALPVYVSQIYKDLLFDWPEAYVMTDRLVAEYGLEKLQYPNSLPEAAKVELLKLYETPYWNGLYDQLAPWLTKADATLNFDAPLFEKIRQGEIWRLFSPILLHANLLHLVFNMLWIVILGRQMEKKLGSARYLLFILISAAFSNTIQYLMSGIFFVGISGVICAMITFIWFRQRKAPWEGYQLAPSTMGFFVAYVLFFFLLEVSSLFAQAFFNISYPVSMANTAHIMGALAGYILAKFDFFELKIP